MANYFDCQESDKKIPSVEIVVDALCALGSKDFSVDVSSTLFRINE